MAKKESRQARWDKAIALARDGLNTLQDAMSDLENLRTEFEEWKDSLDGKFEGSAMVEKLEAIVDLGFDSACDEIESLIDDASEAELPLGFGRD